MGKLPVGPGRSGLAQGIGDASGVYEEAPNGVRMALALLHRCRLILPPPHVIGAVAAMERTISLRTLIAGNHAGAAHLPGGLQRRDGAPGLGPLR